jgi:hypothetical protein
MLDLSIYTSLMEKETVGVEDRAKLSNDGKGDGKKRK